MKGMFLLFTALINFILINDVFSNQYLKIVNSEIDKSTVKKDSILNGFFNQSENFHQSSNLDQMNFYELDFTYIGDLFSTRFNNRNNINYLDNISLGISADLEKSFKWKGASFYISVLSNNGSDPNDFAGSAHGTSNIAASNTIKLYQTYLEQNFENGISLLLGLYDLNSEFDTRETSSLFLNPSHGIGLDFAQTGQNGPSIFPNVSLALRAKYKGENPFYFLAGIFDAVPGDPKNPDKTKIYLSKDEGILFSAEIGALNKNDEQIGSKFGLGTWIYSNKFNDLLETDFEGNPLKQKYNSGIYGFFEKRFFNDFSFFGRLGFAFVSAAFSEKFKIAEENLNMKSDMNLEFTYSYQILDLIRVQPNLQYFVNPVFNENRQNIISFGMRLEAALNKSIILK